MVYHLYCQGTTRFPGTHPKLCFEEGWGSYFMRRMMKNQKISIAEQQAFPLAEQRFIKTCGFNLEREKHQRMMKMGLAVREKGIGGIDINALVSFYGSEAFSEGKVKAGTRPLWKLIKACIQDKKCEPAVKEGQRLLQEHQGSISETERNEKEGTRRKISKKKKNLF